MNTQSRALAAGRAAGAAASVEDGDRECGGAAALHQLRDIMPVDPVRDGLGHRPCQAETGQLAHPPSVHGACALIGSPVWRGRRGVAAHAYLICSGACWVAAVLSFPVVLRRGLRRRYPRTAPPIAAHQAWRQLLDSHHARVRQLLQRYGGTEIDTAGDGFFATFDGPTRAIRCACAIRDAVREIGLEIRAGLHTGEIERKGPRPPASRYTSAQGSQPLPSRVKCSLLRPSSSSWADLRSTSPAGERKPSKASQTNGSCLP